MQDMEFFVYEVPHPLKKSELKSKYFSNDGIKLREANLSGTSRNSDAHHDVRLNDVYMEQTTHVYQALRR